jgi:hypothetical protein
LGLCDLATGETVTVTDGFVTIVVRTFTDSNGAALHTTRCTGDETRVT